MPSAKIEGPPIKDVEVKRILVKEITDALEKAYRLRREVYHVIIKENLPENVGAGGILILDKYKKWLLSYQILFIKLIFKSLFFIF